MRKGNEHILPCFLRSLLDGDVAAQDDDVGERHLLPAALCVVEAILDTLQTWQHFGDFPRVVGVPILLRRETYSRPVCATALIRAAERGRRRPRGPDEFGAGQARSEN